MSDSRTRIDALLNPAGTVAARSGPVNGSAPDVTVYVDGRQVTPDANGSTAVEITPTGFTPATVPGTAGNGAPTGTSQGAGPTVPAHRPPVHQGSGFQPAQQPAHKPPAHQGSGFQPAHNAPVEDVKGLGKNAAQADITDPGGKQHVPYTVHKNQDGSLDITVPKGPGHPHDTRIHVAAGKHVQLDLSQDKSGHVKVHALPAPPQGGAGPDTPGKDAPAVPKAVKPPKTAGGGPAGASPPPGGGGGSPSGGGGPPSGGGGGGMPSGFPPSPNNPAQGSGGDNQTKNADQTAMKQLGDKLASQPGAQMTDAASKTSQIHVGFPSFGVLGLPLNATHDTVRQSAVRYLADGHDQLRKWKSALYGNAANWNGAENNSTLPTA
jgi:hypothetical protein